MDALNPKGLKFDPKDIKVWLIGFLILAGCLLLTSCLVGTFVVRPFFSQAAAVRTGTGLGTGTGTGVGTGTLEVSETVTLEEGAVTDTPGRYTRMAMTLRATQSGVPGQEDTVGPPPEGTFTPIFYNSPTVSGTPPTATLNIASSATRTPTGYYYPVYPTITRVYYYATWTRTRTRTLTPTGTVTPTRTITPTPTTTNTTTVTNTRQPNRIGYSQGASAYILAVMYPDGSGVTTISTSGTQNLLWDWSPNGTRMLFSSQRGSPAVTQLYGINADGTAESLIPRLPAGENSQGAYSPDGQWIIFRNLNAGVGNLYILRLSSGAARNITGNTDAAIDYTTPDWSPNGSQVVFVSNRDGSPDIYILTITNGIQPTPTPLPAPDRWSNTPTLNESWPRYSPDGGTLLFAGFNTAGSRWDVFSAPLSDPGSLTNWTGSDPQDNFQPAWSRDGSRIVYTSTREGAGTGVLFIIDTLTGTQTRINNGSTQSAQPNWMP
jgi:hypothetical protein